MVKLISKKPNGFPSWTYSDDSKVKHPWDSDDGNSYDDKTYSSSSGTLLATVSKIEFLRSALKAFAKSSFDESLAWRSKKNKSPSSMNCLCPTTNTYTQLSRRQLRNHVFHGPTAGNFKFQSAESQTNGYGAYAAVFLRA